MTQRIAKKPGSRVTSLDVAALAGVSQAAVSRAFGGSGAISPALRAKVFKAAEQLNYVPNSMAGSLASRRSGIVAVIHGDMHNPFFVAALQTFGAKLQERQHQMLTVEVTSRLTADEALMRMLRYQVDGIVLAAAQLSMRVTNLVQQRGIPLVLFSRELPGHEVTCVYCDNVEGGRQVAEAFLATGAKKFAVMTAFDNVSTSQDRARGFREFLLEAGVPLSHIQSCKGHSRYELAQQAVRELFTGAADQRPDALFCVNDIMAIGALDTLRYELGLRVPEDVLVAGFDNIADGARAPYRLTTVAPPLDAMVERTLDLLNAAEASGTRNVKLAGELVFRDSLPAHPRAASGV